MDSHSDPKYRITFNPCLGYKNLAVYSLSGTSHEPDQFSKNLNRSPGYTLKMAGNAAPEISL